MDDIQVDDVGATLVALGTLSDVAVHPDEPWCVVLFDDGLFIDWDGFRLEDIIYQVRLVRGVDDIMFVQGMGLKEGLHCIEFAS
jgi:hypothetical protein